MSLLNTERKLRLYIPKKDWISQLTISQHNNKPGVTAAVVLLPVLFLYLLHPSCHVSILHTGVRAYRRLTYIVCVNESPPSVIRRVSVCFVQEHQVSQVQKALLVLLVIQDCQVLMEPLDFQDHQVHI